MTSFSWFEAPEHVKANLQRAVESWEDTEKSSQYVLKALEEDRDNLNVLVSAYRFFFYRQNYSMAIQVALKIMDMLRSKRNIPEEKREMLAYLRSNLEDYDIRLFINAYSAYAFMLMRLGSLEKATEILSLLKEIDEKGEFGISTMLGLIEVREDDNL
ncbi:hypothetical protein IAE16_06565 [Hydrogenobacter sp. T-2]|uniref:hypothetical protein n=1 Tax=Pampinifervens diazotrophicum TaxID=1632018 RepID=UPI002B256D8F|nr:hypothetical protein [Hydrogenobacter sp. T-2]WPM31481.1 hypothetical protein IAE16_06565 [Hydrogenobacter sp. T-2]